MNKIFRYTHKKAAVMVCLFLFYYTAHSQEWQFNKTTGAAYEYALNLQTQAVHELIPEPKTPQEHYVTSLAEALELLVTEDLEKYGVYERNFEKRASRKLKKADVDEMFMEAEIHLHWAFVYLKFGHEFDAALNFRHAYNITQDIRKRFPKFIAIMKTAGLLDVIVGSIPEKYNWVLSILQMSGTVKIGLEEFEVITQAEHPLSFEAGLWHAFTQSFVLQQPEVALRELSELLKRKPENRLALFLGANLHLKNNDSEKALTMLLQLDNLTDGLPLYYTEYLKGEIFLHKAEYLNSISSFRSFINHYKGQNYVKDSHYKIGLNYWLNGNKSDALAVFQQAKSLGKEETEADKYAARSLADPRLPHVALAKVRYYTDGGYFTSAKTILQGLDSNAFAEKKDQVEYFYRKARLAHQQNDIEDAKRYYTRTIETNGDEEWYFAPNASLQLGYIARNANDNTNAKLYFTRALSYKKHEYKNSIDSKARSALAQLKNSK